MREISCGEIRELVERLCIEAATVLPDDLCRTIHAARETEESPVGQGILQDIEDNFLLAREKGVPICQDTGMAVVFLELGQEVHITGGSLRDAVNMGVHDGYLNGALRCSVVEDPLRRVNTGDNTPAVLHVELVEGDAFRVTIAPKGFGSENMSAMKMFTPAASREDIEEWIVSCVNTAGSNPCPPVIVGVGIGGTIEQCALEAKKALLAPMDAPNEDPFYADMEEKTLEKINRLGIGPQGMGGRVTALGVHIRPYPTHIAGLPCVVNMSCHVTRHACGEL
ncbi:MAG: fumarate hydratase [Oscillospiraceae bacterium]|nr:fumarate hydratase [Oscillospiraceae bacterium]